MTPTSGCKVRWKHCRSTSHGEGTRRFAGTLCCPLESIHIDRRHCCDSDDGASWARLQGHERSRHRPAYRIREAGDTGKPLLYRFQKPADASYPFMLELFCRSPDGILLADRSRLTPIPFDEVVSSLSAILL